MGGRIAEEMIFGPERITTGAASDIKQVTELVRRMVTEWGMSENLGFLLYGEPTQEIFLGHTVAQHRDMSEETARLVDKEVRRVIDSCYQRATRILKEYADELEVIAQALLEYEILSGEEIQQVLNGEKLQRSEPNPQETSATKPRRTSVPTSHEPDLEPEFQHS